MPPAERLKKYRREAEDKLNSYKEKANKLATGIAKELELPDTMVPKILKCLSGHDLADFQVFGYLGAAQDRYVLFDQHSSADVTEDSQSEST